MSEKRSRRLENLRADLVALMDLVLHSEFDHGSKSSYNRDSTLPWTCLPMNDAPQLLNSVDMLLLSLHTRSYIETSAPFLMGLERTTSVLRWFSCPVTAMSDL